MKSVGKQAIHSTLNTNVITGLDTCQLHVPQQCIAIHFEHERYFFFLAPSSLQGLGFGLLYWAVSRQRRNCRTGQSPGNKTLKRGGGQIQARLFKRGLGFGWAQRALVACRREVHYGMVGSHPRCCGRMCPHMLAARAVKVA